MQIRGAGIGEQAVPSSAGEAREAGSGADFAGALAEAAGALTQRQGAAAHAVEQFTSGVEGNLHETLLAVQKAEISMKLLVSVRNRLVEAYREIMRMGM